MQFHRKGAYSTSIEAEGAKDEVIGGDKLLEQCDVIGVGARQFLEHRATPFALRDLQVEEDFRDANEGPETKFVLRDGAVGIF